MISAGLTTPEVEYRYETKIPLQRGDFQEIRALLTHKGVGLATAYPDRVIHSVYLDTPELDDYQENIAGISNRKKVRFRWYGEEVQNLSLEIKTKKSQISGKHRLAVENRKNLYPRSSVVTRELRRQKALNVLRIFFPIHHPVLEVTYDRAYFELKPGIRMTIDNNICYRRLFPNISGRLARSPVDSVIELKYGVNDYHRVREILKSLPTRIFRHSKYVVGIDTAFPT